MEEDGKGLLFDGVTFTIIPSDKLTNGQIDHLISVVILHGGRYVPLAGSDQKIGDLLALSHIISTNVDFPQYLSALEHDVSVVKPSWVFQSFNKGKLAGTRPHSPDPAQFLQDVVVTCAELPDGDKDAIIAGVLALGGQYSSPLTKLVTHIVTSDPSHEKCQLAEEKRLNLKVVVPHWFDDCFKLGKKITETPYMFPDPEILRKESAGPVRSTSSPQLDGAVSARPSGMPVGQTSDDPPTSPSESRKNLNALMGRRILLSKDLELSEHLITVLHGLVEYAGGMITDDVDQADIYIGHYRDGADYLTASRANKEVANLSWLYHVINHNKYTNPLSKLLHYPIPRDGLRGFENMRISISNYTGDSRIYLENLIRHCGAEFTKTMKQDNTHLITAHTQSEKCEAAQEWNINIINHLWLEESYAKCSVQTLTNPRYLHFPARTNLSEVVGQTSLDMRKVEGMFFKLRESPQRPKPVTVTPSNAKFSPRKPVPVLSAPGTATPHSNAPIAAPTPTAEDPKTENEDAAQPSTTQKPRGRPRKSAATPRHGDDEKENQSPMFMSSGRASKAKALEVMHEQAGDIALFQREMKRRGGVTHGGSRLSNAEELSSPALAPKNRKKRSSDEATYEVTADGSDLSDGETQHKPPKASKKAKHDSTAASLAPIQYKMMVTGDERWNSKPKQEDADKTKLRLLGVQLVQDAAVVDILVAPRILRTRKFVCALACAPLVVHTSYLDSALKLNKLQEKPKLLEDRESEDRLGFRLVDALERATINQRKLLRGWHIFITKDLSGGFPTYKDIVTLNGGEAYMYQGRTGVTLPKRRLREDPEAGSESQHQGGDEEFDHIYLVSGTTEPESKYWKTFRDLARKQDLEARIVKSDWLINAAMSQQIRWDRKWALDEAAISS